MNKVTIPGPRRLREMALTSSDPIIRDALNDLAAEYEREAREKESVPCAS